MSKKEVMVGTSWVALAKIMETRIETGRFYLRPLVPDDATERYMEWLREPMAQQFIVAAKDTHDLKSLRGYIAQKSGRAKVLFLGIFLQQDSKHIGNIKYEPINPEEGYAVMGILIGDPDWRGKGVAAEVLEASAQWLKANLGIARIELDVKRKNLAAIRAYQKAGFEVEDTGHIMHDSETSITMVRRLNN